MALAGGAFCAAPGVGLFITGFSVAAIRWITAIAEPLFAPAARFD